MRLTASATTVERLLNEMACDLVVPVRYSRKSVAARCSPVAMLVSMAVGAVTLSVALGRL